MSDRAIVKPILDTFWSLLQTDTDRDRRQTILVLIREIGETPRDSAKPGSLWSWGGEKSRGSLCKRKKQSDTSERRPSEGAAADRRTQHRINTRGTTIKTLLAPGVLIDWGRSLIVLNRLAP